MPKISKSQREEITNYLSKKGYVPPEKRSYNITLNDGTNLGTVSHSAYQAILSNNVDGYKPKNDEEESILNKYKKRSGFGELEYGQKAYNELKVTPVAKDVFTGLKNSAIEKNNITAFVKEKSPGSYSVYINTGKATKEVFASLTKQQAEDKVDDINLAVDFAVNSRYKSSANGKERKFSLWNPGQVIESGYDDLTHDYINKNEDAKAVVTVDNQAFNKTALGLDKNFLQQMTQDEVDAYNYFYNKYGKEAATEFVKQISSDLTLRERVASEKKYSELAKTEPIKSSVWTVMSSPLKVITALNQVTDYAKDGHIDQNASYNKYSYNPKAVRDTVSKSLGKVGGFLYQTGMSIGDSAMNTIASGGNKVGSLGLMGIGAFADTVVSSKDRGLSDDQAMGLGIIAGAAEIFTESFSFDALFNAKNIGKAAGKNALTSTKNYILDNIKTNALEELGADGINFVADVFIAKDKSEWQQSIKAYKKAGYSDSQAWGLAFKDTAVQMGLSALAGALSGATMSAPSGLLINSRIKAIGKENSSNFMDILGTGLGYEQNSEAYKNATNLFGKKSEISDYDLGRQVLLNNVQEVKNAISDGLKQDKGGEAYKNARQLRKSGDVSSEDVAYQNMLNKGETPVGVGDTFVDNKYKISIKVVDRDNDATTIETTNLTTGTTETKKLPHSLVNTMLFSDRYTKKATTTEATPDVSDVKTPTPVESTTTTTDVSEDANESAQQEQNEIVSAETENVTEAKIDKPKLETQSTTEESSEASDTQAPKNIFTDELDEIVSTEMPSVSVGDSFFDKKLNISIKVMGRDANNTTIEKTNLSTGAKETKLMPNNMADSLLVDDRYTKVKTPITSTTEESSEASDTQAPKNINLRRVGKNYEVYGNDALTLASEIDGLETTRGIVNGVETDVLRIPANLADGLAKAFDGEYNLVMNDKPVTTTPKAENQAVPSENKATNETVSSESEKPTEGEIVVVAEALKHTLTPEAKNDLQKGEVKENYARIAKALIKTYESKGTITEDFAGFFTDGGKKVDEVIGKIFILRTMDDDADVSETHENTSKSKSDVAENATTTKTKVSGAEVLKNEPESDTIESKAEKTSVEREDVGNEPIRESVLSGDSRRRGNESTRKQVGRVSYFERRNQGRDATERQNFARELIERGQVEEVIDGKDKYNLVKPEAYNDDMLSMVEEAKKNGIELGFFVGTAKINYDTKDEFSARGIRLSSTKVVVQYDSADRTPQQIAKHEIIHTKWNTPAIQKIKEFILNSLSEERKQEILSQKRYKRYNKIYKGKKNLVWEEFVCDVMSGMNEYTEQFADTVNDYWYGNESAEGYTPSTYAESIDAGGNATDVQKTTQSKQKTESKVKHSTKDLLKISKKNQRRYSLSSMGAAFFGNENISSEEFEKMLEDGSYKKQKGYIDYVKECTKVYKQSRGMDGMLPGSEVKKIEKQIEGIMRVAIAAKKAGYDIFDNGEARSKRDSQNRLLFSSLEPNSDYVTSSDISTICDKRTNFSEIYDEIVRLEEERGVSTDKRFFNNIDNYFILHKIMADKGLTIPCEECYVESMRKNLGKMAKSFIDLVTENDENNKSNEQLYHQKGKNKGKLKTANATRRNTVRELLAENDVFSIDDLTPQLLTTAKGLTKLRLQAPLVYEQFNAFYGQAKPKLTREATPFRPGELIALLTKSDGTIDTNLVKEIVATGGFRLQSYSDFQIKNFVDVLQTIFEAGMLGLNGHAYTKVPAFLEATEGTNLKRNISIFMYEDGGQWKLDKKNSFPMELEDIYALVASDESGNTGIIAVSQNADMSAWIMANDFVGYGIPFHKSGLKMEVVRGRIVKTPDGREVFGYANEIDHTKQQSEVYKKTISAKEKVNTKVKKPINIYSFWDFKNKDNLSKKELIEKNVKKYIDECEKRQYRPKFRAYVMNNSKLLNKTLEYAKELGYVSQDATIDDISFKHGEYTIPYGYYKFLGDFGMFKPDGTASTIERLSLENYDFDKAVDFFKDSGKLRTNELLQQFENGKVREEYRKMVENGEMTAEQLDDILKEKRNQIANDVVESRYDIDEGGEYDGGRERFQTVHDVFQDEDAERRNVLSYSTYQGSENTRRKGQDSSEADRGTESEVRFSIDNYAPTFYSHMSRTIDGMKDGKHGANSVVPYLTSRGVKAEEIKWSGIEEFLDGKKSITKAELQEFAKNSQLQIVEETSNSPKINLRELGDDEHAAFVWYDENGNEIDRFAYDYAGELVSQKTGESYLDVDTLKEELSKKSDTTRWRQYKLDGGENYREITFKMPNSDYTNSAMQMHWGEDAQGILAHARVQDFEVDGKKMLFIEELQSDWHNEGHKKGYSPKVQDSRVEEAKNIYDELESGTLDLDKWIVLREEFEQLQFELEQEGIDVKDFILTVPDAPFHDNYHEYVLKNLIRMAAEHGYDSIGWTPSEVQMDRWNKGRLTNTEIGIEDAKNPDAVAFEEAYRIEYDQDIPKFLNKYGKKWGAKANKTKLSIDTLWSEDYAIWIMPITDSMKESVLYEGQPRYDLSEEENNNIVNDIGLGNDSSESGMSTDANATSTTIEDEIKALTPERKKEIFEQFKNDRAEVDKPTRRQIWGERVEYIAHHATRVFPDIPERGEKGTFFAEFRKMMLQWKALPQTSMFMTQDKLNQMTKDLTPDEFNTFSELVYFLDLQEEAQIQKERGFEEILLPNEITPHEVNQIVDVLNQEATDNVKKALAKRQQIWDSLKEQYIALNQYVGFDTSERFKRKNYYSHQVIEYMNQGGKGVAKGKDIEIKAGRGWLKERQGSTKAINTDFLAVEYKAMLQMQYDIYVANILGKIKDKYDIKPQLEKQAFDHNKNLLNEKIAEEAKDENGNVLTDNKGKPDSETYRQQQWYNQRIMYGFSRLFDLAKADALPTLNGQYGNIIESLKKGNLKAPGLYTYIGELASMELSTTATEEEHQAQISARTIMKYTSQKKAWVKETLADDYQTWETLANEMKETHSVHQPRRGNYFYTKEVINEDAFSKAFSDMIVGLVAGENGVDTTADIRKLFGQYSETIKLIGAAYEQWVIPNEIETTMNKVANPKQVHAVSQASRAVLSTWKGWSTSVNPLRTVKFGIRNMFGDLDAVIAGNPKVVGYSKQAVGEIYQAMKHKKYSKEFMEWVERGGYSAMIFANEMDTEMQDKLFSHLKEKKGMEIFKIPAKIWEGYYNGVETAHNFREAILRYSAYLYYKNDIIKNGGKAKDNVASNRYIIQGLESVEDKAYQLSKDLLGAYDEVASMGQALRRHAIPFYSFTETNLKRYYRLFENIIMSDDSIPKKAGKLMLKGLMVNMLSLLMVAWNKLVMGDEDDELPTTARNVPHITLGKIGDDVYAFRQLGSFSELLEWIGFEDYKWTEEDKTAPLDKVAGMITPIAKTPVELITGLNFYPSITQPRAIRDRWEHFFNTLGVAEVYKNIVGKPTKGLGKVMEGSFIYSYDYKESAYYEILDIKRKYQGDEDGSIYKPTPKSNALYYMKTAIRYKDKKAALKYLDEYFENGGTGKGISQSIAMLDPMYGFTSKDNYEKGQSFIASLSDDEKEKLKVAQDYYEKDLALTGSISSYLRQSGITDKQAKQLLTNYINSKCK